MERRGWHTIRTRLFLLFLLCMLGLLLIASFLYYERTTGEFHRKIGDIAQKNVSQTVELFDLLLKGYDSLTKAVNGNFDLQRLLAEPNQDAAVKFINERTITNMLGTVYYSHEDVIGIHVIAKNGAVYSYENYVYAIDEHYAESDWYRQLRSSTGEMVWLGVHPASLIDPTLKRPVFAFGRQMYDLLEQKPIGTLLIEVDPRAMLAALGNLKLGEHSEVVVVSGNGQVMASTAPEAEMPAALRDLRLPGAQADGQVIVDQRPDRLVVAAKPAMADWTIASMTPDADVNVELRQTEHFLLIVVSALVVLAIAIATFVSRTISSPLKRLIHEMKQVEMGNFRGALNVKSYEEINILVASFNQMVRRMDDLIERVKLSSISEKNAQLQALQSQVNPHFLYNTLDMIYWMLDEKENDRLGKVVLALSQLFRYSSSWEEGSAATLREELTQTRHYLTIIGSRLEGRFSARIEVEEPWLDTVRLPKMTLQPILENAVKYGLEPLQGRPGLLRVYARAAGNELQLVVEDNGMGMEPAAFERLQAALGAAQSAAPQSRRGIGLRNLQLRLVAMYGKSYGLRVKSRHGAGTTVVVAVPLPWPRPQLQLQSGQGGAGR
jgi:two-component system sensor histidine kinase YesM